MGLTDHDGFAVVHRDDVRRREAGRLAATDLCRDANAHLTMMERAGSNGCYLRAVYTCSDPQRPSAFAVKRMRVSVGYLEEVGALLRPLIAATLEGLNPNEAAPCWLSLVDVDGLVYHHCVCAVQAGSLQPQNLEQDLQLVPQDGAEPSRTSQQPRRSTCPHSERCMNKMGMAQPNTYAPPPPLVEERPNNAAAERQRREEERAAEQQRRADERAAEQQRREEEQQRRADERAAEQQRRADERAAEQQRRADERAAEQKRREDERERRAEDQRGRRDDEPQLNPYRREQQEESRDPFARQHSAPAEQLDDPAARRGQARPRSDAGQRAMPPPPPPQRDTRSQPHPTRLDTSAGPDTSMVSGPVVVDGEEEVLRYRGRRPRLTAPARLDQFPPDEAHRCPDSYREELWQIAESSILHRNSV